MNHVHIRLVDVIVGEQNPRLLGDDDPDKDIKHPCAPVFDKADSLAPLPAGTAQEKGYYEELGGGNLVSDPVFDVTDATLWPRLVQRALAEGKPVADVVTEALERHLAPPPHDL